MKIKVLFEFLPHGLLLFLVFTGGYFTQGLVTNEGKEFYLIVNEHIRYYSTCDLFLMTRHPAGARVKVRVPLNPTLQPAIDVSVHAGESVKVALKKDILMAGFGKSKNGIYITSDEEIAVQIMSQSQAKLPGDTVGGYLAFPYTALGTEYMSVTYCSRYSCYIGLMATTNSTVVTLRFKSTVILNGVVCVAGTTKHLNLDQYESFQITSTDDLTGIRIISNNVISVTVGADGTPVDGAEEDYVIEQLPPVTALGTEHYLLPMPLRTMGDFVRVVAVGEETLFYVDGEMYEMKLVGDHQDLSLTPTVPQFLQSSHPVLVAQFCKSSSLSDTRYTDPNLLIVTPVRQWVGSYVFATPALAQNNNAFHLALVATNNCTQEIKLDHDDILEPWIPLINSSVSMTTITLTTEYHNITHKTGCRTIWGYIYGTALQQSWALPIGWAFQPYQDSRVTNDFSVLEKSTMYFQTQAENIDSSDSTSIMVEPTFTLFIMSDKSSLTDTLSLEASSNSMDFKPTKMMSDSSTPSTTVHSDDRNSILTISSSSVFHSGDYMSTQQFENTATSTVTSLATSLTVTVTEPTPAHTNVPSKHQYTNLCVCRCFPTIDTTLDARILESQLKLSVDKDKLSSTIRKKTSIPDDRRSAQVVGCTGVIFIVLVLSWAVIPDIFTALRFLCYILCRRQDVDSEL